MQILRRVVVVLAALALSVPAVALAQTGTTGQGASGVSTQPPVSLGGEEPKPAAKPPASARAGALPNTGSDPRLLFLVGVALTLLGVGLRLRTADADLY